jgi:hypothetical protein
MSLEATTQKKPTLEINASRQFTAWLHEPNISLLLQLIKTPLAKVLNTPPRCLGEGSVCFTQMRGRVLYF